MCASHTRRVCFYIVNLFLYLLSLTSTTHRSSAPGLYDQRVKYARDRSECHLCHEPDLTAGLVGTPQAHLCTYIFTSMSFLFIPRPTKKQNPWYFLDNDGTKSSVLSMVNAIQDGSFSNGTSETFAAQTLNGINNKLRGAPRTQISSACDQITTCTTFTRTSSLSTDLSPTSWCACAFLLILCSVSECQRVKG